LSTLISKTVGVFMEKWYEGMRGQNLAGLIELVLQGQQLSPVELKGFVRALPQALLERIVTSTIGATGTYGKGLHALMAVEIHLRKSAIRDYTLSKEGERLHIEFIDPKRDAIVKFFLDEPLRVDDEEKTPTQP
jgi:hypothetical protein